MATLNFRGGFTRKERKMIRNIVRKYGFDLGGIQLWRGEGSPSNYSASWGNEGMTFYDNAFNSQEELAKSIFEELQHKQQALDLFGGDNVQQAEDEAEENLNRWWR